MFDQSNIAESTEMLRAGSCGDHEIGEDFVRFVYDELRKQARRYLRNERTNHTLQTTALVHEAFLRLLEQKQLD